MQEAAFPAFLGVPLPVTVCQKNTGGSDPVHSFHKKSVPFSSPKADRSHETAGKQYGYWIWFWAVSRRSPSAPHQTQREIDREYRFGPAPELRPSALVSVINANRAAFEIYITPCQSQNLTFSKRASKGKMNGNPKQRKTTVMQ